MVMCSTQYMKQGGQKNISSVHFFFHQMSLARQPLDTENRGVAWLLKKKKGKCSEARKSACLQRHFHPDGISPQEGGSKEELGFGFCLCFRQMRHSLIFNIFLPKCVVLFLLISHILLGRSFYVTMLSFCSLADARAGWTCCEMWLSSRGAVLWVGECWNSTWRRKKACSLLLSGLCGKGLVRGFSRKAAFLSSTPFSCLIWTLKLTKEI